MKDNYWLYVVVFISAGVVVFISWAKKNILWGKVYFEIPMQIHQWKNKTCKQFMLNKEGSCCGYKTKK